MTEYRPEDDDEAFCPDCHAGTESDEHYDKCVRPAPSSLSDIMLIEKVAQRALLTRYEARAAIAAVCEHRWVYNEPPADMAEYERGFGDGEAMMAAVMDDLASEWEARGRYGDASLTEFAQQLRAVLAVGGSLDRLRQVRRQAWDEGHDRAEFMARRYGHPDDWPHPDIAPNPHRAGEDS